MKNPPSIIRLFTVMRERVIAGEPWRKVLADYGFYPDHCKGKLPYTDKASALLHASLTLRNPRCDTRQFRPYRCPNCKCWHLTKGVR